MPGRRDFHKIIIGRSEAMSFVDPAILHVPAKTDTGAYRSAIHASDIFIDKEGFLNFTLFGNHPIFNNIAIKSKTNKFQEVFVANSFGHREARYEVKLKVKLGPKVFFATFSLADRSKKIYPILLGRKLLNGRFLVDSDKSSVNRLELKEKYSIKMPGDEEDGR